MIEKNSPKFSIKIESFEGPIDLLLSLIESEKLDVTTVSLASVADGFIGYISKAENVSAGMLVEFLDIASKLILIKSKVLLPQLVLTQEEEEDINELERRLREFQIFKRISRELETFAKSDRRGFSRKTKSAPEITLFDPPESVDKDKLFDIFKGILSRVPEEDKKEKADSHDAVIEPAVSIEEKVDEISTYFKTNDSFSFMKFLKSAKTKTEVIVSFLAVLELLRLRKIDIAQDDNFSGITIIKKDEVLTINHD